MQDKIKFLVLYNPFDTYDRKEFLADYQEDAVISEYLHGIDFPPDSKFVAALNGYAVNMYEVCPQPGDIVSVSVDVQPGAIASAAASYVASAIAVTTTTYVTTLVTAYAISYAVAYTATTFAIGWGASQLLGALGGGPQIPDLGNVGGNASESPTYGWGALQNTQTEGNPIPIVFGTHRVAGQIINKFTEVKDDNKEYYNALIAINDGEVANISDIRVNDQPVTYYQDVNCYTRLGKLDDDPIDGFSELVQHRNLSVRVSEDWFTQSTDGNQVEKLKIIFTAPSGMYYTNNSGGLDERHADVKIQYRAISSFEWISYDTIRIKGATTEAIRKSITIEGLPPEQYEIRIKRLNSEESSFKGSNKVYWSGLQEIVDEKLSYPGVAKYAVKALATDQLSGQEPRLSCVVSRDYVSVYDPYDEKWELRPANNPAWAVYSLLNQYAHIHHSRIAFDDFDDWAQYCNEDVDGEPRFQVNIVFDNTSNVWDAAQRIAKIGRAVILRRGSKYGVFVDKPETDVTHLFSIGNIIEDSFTLQYLPQKDRANAVEITYVDPDREYSNQIVGIYSDAYRDSGTIEKKSSVKVNAAIPRAQAVREAAFMLNSNKHLIRIIEFEAAVDSFACTIGDLVYFQHFIPQYNDSMGGRILDAGNDDGSGNTYVVLDQSIELKAGTSYGILVRDQYDNIIEKSLQSVVEDKETDTLLLQGSWQEVPQKDDLYVCGPADVYKKTYRVTNITRAQDFTRRITCIEYVDAIYNDTGYVIENPAWDGEIHQQAVNVSLNEFLTYGAGGDYQSNLSITWNPASSNVGSNWAVWLEDVSLNQTFEDSFDDGFKNSKVSAGVSKVGETSENKMVIGAEYLKTGHTYQVYVCNIDDGFEDTGYNTSRIQIMGKLAPPDRVTSFVGTWNPMKRTVNFTWKKVDNLDVSHYEIRQGNAWDDGEVVVSEAKKNSTSIPIDEGVAETRTYWIKSVDTSGTYSDEATYVQVAIDTYETPLDIPTGLSLTSQSGIASDGTDHVTIVATWDSNSELSNDFHHYVLIVEEMSSTSKATYTTEETQYQFEVIPATEYGVSVKAVDISGNSTDYCAQEVIFAAKDDTPPSAPNWSSTPLVPGFKVIGLRWQPSTAYDLSHYEVQRSISGEFNGEEVDIGDKDGNFTTDTDLAVDTTYYYRVCAVDTSGNKSDWSDVQSATTLKVGSEDIAYNAIIAQHIDVTNLSAINADLGQVTAGVLESQNWGSSDGTRFDLDNGVLSVGGSDNPSLSWDGVNLDMTGTMTITGGTGALNLNDGPAESGADVTANNPQSAAWLTDGGALATLDSIDTSYVNDAGDLATVDADALVYFSSTAPATPANNPLWGDTSSTPYKLKRWNGETWDIIATLNTGALADVDAADWQSQVTGVTKPNDVQKQSANIATAGWYRIAINPGNRAKARFILTDTGSSRHNNCEFLLSCNYNRIDNAVFTLLDASRYSTKTFSQIRLLTNGTYDDMFVEVYIDNADNTSCSLQILDNVQTSGWNSVDFIAGSIPAGYNSTVWAIDPSKVVDVTGDNTANDVLTGAGKAVAEHGATNDAAWRSAEDTSKIDGGNIYAGSKIQVGNLDGHSDYCEITDGDIDFYYYFGGSHKHYKSLKRIEGGKNSDGDRVYIPGYWKKTPNIWTFPFSIETYNPDYANQPQTTDCYPENITQYSTGKYYFDMVAASFMKSPVLPTDVNESFYHEYPDSGDNLTTDNFITNTYTTIDNVVEIIFDYEWECMCSDQQGTRRERIYADIYVTIDGSETLVESFTYEDTGDDRVVKGGSNTKKISVSSGSHNISMRAYLRTHNDNSTYDPASYNSFTWHSYETSSSGNVRLNPGSARWIAIGE